MACVPLAVEQRLEVRGVVERADHREPQAVGRDQLATRRARRRRSSPRRARRAPRPGRARVRSSTSRRSPNIISPCGLSSWRTKRPFAKLRAFSSSSAGSGSAAILRSSPAIVATASSMRRDVDARLRVERAGVGVAVVEPVDVVGEPAPLAHLGEEARRHPAAERGREQLERVAVGMVERQARHAEDDVRLVGLPSCGRRRGRSRAARRAPARRSRRRRGRRAAPARARAARRRSGRRRRAPCATACTTGRGSR